MTALDVLRLEMIDSKTCCDLVGSDLFTGPSWNSEESSELALLSSAFEKYPEQLGQRQSQLLPKTNVQSSNMLILLLQRDPAG